MHTKMTKSSFARGIHVNFAENISNNQKRENKGKNYKLNLEHLAFP